MDLNVSGRTTMPAGPQIVGLVALVAVVLDPHRAPAGLFVDTQTENRTRDC
jgi:hypothetical protein